MKKITMLFVLFFITSYLGAQTQTETQEMNLPSYVKTGKHVFSDWQAVEKVQNTVRETQKAFYKHQKKMMETLRKQNGSPSIFEDQNKNLRQQIRLLGRILDNSRKIDVPEFKDSGLNALAEKVVELHHAWANKQGEKLMAMLHQTPEKANQLDKEATQLLNQVNESLEKLIKVVSTPE